MRQVQDAHVKDIDAAVEVGASLRRLHPLKKLARPLGDFAGMTRARFGVGDAAESAFDHFDGVNGSAAPS